VPIRFEYFDVPKKATIEPPIPPGTGDRAVIKQDGIFLVKLDIDKDRYAPDGRFSEAFIQAPNWVAENLTEYFSFEVDGHLDPIILNQPDSDKATISFQLSNDNGVTWRVWVDGPDAWLPATGPLDGVFNDTATVDRRIPVFPFGNPRQLQFRIKLTPGANGLQRYVVRSLVIFNKHRLDIYEDVTRSLKRHIDAKIRVPMYYMAELAAPSTPIHIETDVGLDDRIIEPITVYNLGTDPARNNNLFLSLGGPDGRTVTMVGTQIGQIEVNFTGVPDVFVGAEEFLNISKMPSIVIFVTKLEQYLNIREWNNETERSIPQLMGRSQPSRINYRMSIVVRTQSSLKREALRMVDVLCRFLDQGDFFYSVANGETYNIHQQTNSVSEDRIAQGIYVGAVNLMVFGKVWLKDSEDVPLVEEVHLAVGSQDTSTLLIPNYLRRIYRENSEIKE